jgi:hypothetical protein
MEVSVVVVVVLTAVANCRYRHILKGIDKPLMQQMSDLSDFVWGSGWTAANTPYLGMVITMVMSRRKAAHFFVV